jgi:hypothetical protein
MGAVELVCSVMVSGLRIGAVQVLIGVALLTYPSFARGFEFGLYGLPVSRNFPKAVEEVADKGFRLAVVGARRDLVDILHARGMRAVVALWLRRSDVASEEAWLAFVTRTRLAVQKLARHPALFAWYVSDEPDGQRIPLERVQAACDLVRSLDSATPLFAVFDEPSRWAAYLPLFDIVAVDPYLRADPSGGYASPAVVSQWLTALRDALSERTHNPRVWVVLGAFELRPKTGQGRARYKKPTPDEFRLMVSAALDAGVEGILVYSYALQEAPNSRAWSLPHDDPGLWATVGALPHMLSQPPIR